MGLKEYYNSIVDLIFPPRCHICREPHPEAICNSCHAKINYIDPKDICTFCGEPHGDKLRQEALLCKKCITQKPYFELARSVAIYEGTIRKAIHNFKFKNKKGLADHLCKIMANHIEARLPEIRYCHADALVTVPLSQKRRAERGFNQVALMAEILASYLNIPHEKNALKRIKETLPQFDLPKNERQKNVTGAFDIHSQESIYGKRLLLLDDIYTTGHTINECAKTLKKGGAAKVYALTLSRATLK